MKCSIYVEFYINLKKIFQKEKRLFEKYLVKVTQTKFQLAEAIVKMQHLEYGSVQIRDVNSHEGRQTCLRIN